MYFPGLKSCIRVKLLYFDTIMSRDKFKKGGYGGRNIPDFEMEKEVPANEQSLALGQDSDQGAVWSALSKVLMAEMTTILIELKVTS